MYIYIYIYTYIHIRIHIYIYIYIYIHIDYTDYTYKLHLTRVHVYTPRTIGDAKNPPRPPPPVSTRVSGEHITHQKSQK